MTVELSSGGFIPRGAGGFTLQLANPSPSSGSTLDDDRDTARHTAVSFQVLDGGAPASNVSVPWAIWIKYANDDRGFVVYDSATGFLPPFYNQSTWVASTGTLTLLPDGGWQDTISQICIGGQSSSSAVPVRNGAAGSDPPPNAP